MLNKKNDLFAQGQVSLEFLLMAAALLGLLALFVPVFQSIFSQGLFALEALKVQAFADAFAQKTELLAVLGNDSWAELEVNPSGSWTVSITETELKIGLSQGEKQKQLVRSLSLAAVPTELVVSDAAVVILKKQNNFLIVNLQDR